MADIGFLAEYILSVTIVAGPIVAIVLLLAHPDGSTLCDLFVPRISRDDERLPPEEDPPPRWRLDKIGAVRPSGAV